MYSTELSKTLLKNLENQDYESYYKSIESFSSDEVLGPVMTDLKEEWRKLQIAKKNGLMDDEQIKLAMIAFFKRKNREIFTLLDKTDSDPLHS